MERSRRGSEFDRVAVDARAGVAERTRRARAPGPDRRLPLCQELHKLWTAATSLLVRTSCESAATGGTPEFPSAWRSESTEFGVVFVADANQHMLRDVIACTIGDHELTAALLLRHEREHVGTLGSECRKGRGPCVRPARRFSAAPA
jgi:hypothetical protein